MKTVLPLSDAITLQRGFDLPTSQRRPGKYPVITSTGRTTTHNEARVKGPGVVIGRSGSIGGGQFIQEDFWPLNTTLWVKDFKGNNEKFIYYLLKSIDFSSFNAGAAVPTLNRNHLSSLMVRILERNEQDKIANILGTIDEKIELNRRMNETLEQMGQALFSHYFINNPDVKKWEEVKIGELVNIKGGGTPSTTNPDFWDGDIAWTSPRDLTGKSDAFLLATDKSITKAGLAKISSGLLPEKTLLLSSRAPIGYVALAGLPLAINQGYIAFLPGSYLSNHYMYFWLYYNMGRIKNAANGSTFMEISKSSFRNITNYKPNEKLLQEFESKADELFGMMRNNQEQIQTLTTLRDSLLPRLISGKLKTW